MTKHKPKTARLQALGVPDENYASATRRSHMNRKSKRMKELDRQMLDKANGKENKYE